MMRWIGFAGLAVAATGWLVNPAKFYGGWLAALVVFGGWPLGSLAILLIHSLTGGRWGEVLQPALRVGVCALPLLLPAVLPLTLGLPSLYPWATPHGAEHLGNRFYLNVPFFALRGTIYLIAWFSLGWMVLRARNLAAIAPVGLFLLAITTTFAAIDATMSLDPHFTSSVYGMIAAAGMGLLALSAAVLMTAAQSGPGERSDCAKLLLALVILWVYLDFMQLLIVWQSDLASDAPWYLARSRGGWGATLAVITVGHFVLPFFLLLSPKLQRSYGVIGFVAALLIGMEILRAWWTVLPALGHSVGWIEFACMAGLGGSAAWFAPWMAHRMRPALALRHG